MHSTRTNIPTIASKLPAVGTTIFTVMSHLASEHKAINLGQGFPDFEMDPELSGLVDKAMRDGMNQYAPMAGLPALREALAQKFLLLYGADVHPDTEITITPGGTYAIYTALTTVLSPGDEVILFEPAYDSYIPNIVVNGARPICINLQYPDYTIPWNEVRAAVTPNTKAIIINSPHNPTGSVLTASDVEQLAAVVAGTGIFIISDEVYEHLVFDGLPHQSMLRYPELLQRSFVCFSFGKTYHCTGWKLGYCVAPAAAMAEFRKVHQYNCFSCFTPAQVALAAYVPLANKYLTVGSDMQERRDFFAGLMANTDFEPLPSHGSYFQCYSYRKLSDERDSDFAIRLLKECGVVTIPVSAFYSRGNTDHVVRFCFAKKKATLEAAAHRLAAFGR